MTGSATPQPDRAGPVSGGRLLLSCTDGPGIVAAVSRFLSDRRANITQSDQYSTDPNGGRFYMRMEFALELEPVERAALEEDFVREVAEPFGMDWRVSYEGERKRLAILVSRSDHCLLDLLWRWRRGELEAEIPLVVSNHPDLAEEVGRFDVRYEHVPVNREGKAEAEAKLLGLLGGDIDLVVLARYMQILSREFLEALGAPVINIHHSFLPAFAGAGPYEQARERGVKLVGATAHYVTEELDAGPIIEQDVARVTHRDTVDALGRVGAEIERRVLERAVRWHLEDRVLVDGNRTVVLT